MIVIDSSGPAVAAYFFGLHARKLFDSKFEGQLKALLGDIFI
jgi:hypothetical protein